MTENHSLIVIECRECAAVDTVTHLEHPQDSPQHHAVLDAHDRLASEHNEECGHTVDAKHYSGSPAEVLEMARSHARQLDGVADDAFSDEVTA